MQKILILILRLILLFFSIIKEFGTTEIYNDMIISCCNMQLVTNETLWNVDDGYFIFVFVCKIRISSDEEASKSKLDCGYLRICFTGNTAKKN